MTAGPSSYDAIRENYDQKSAEDKILSQER